MKYDADDSFQSAHIDMSEPLSAMFELIDGVDVLIAQLEFVDA